jgi:multiple sugar transport system permease protein
MAGLMPPRRLLGYALLLPAFLPVLGLLVYPVVHAVALSLTDSAGWRLFGSFVGLDNYRRLAGDPIVWRAARNTVVLVGVTAAVELVVGVLTALLLWWKFWGRALVFFSVFVPWAFPATFSAFAWYWFFSPPFHTFYANELLTLRWWLDDALGAGAWQVLSIATMSVWRGSSIIAIFLLAGFNAIPEELLDVGRLETRGPWQFFWRVVAPLSRRLLTFAALVALVITYVEYASMYVETGGRITVPVLGTLAFRESARNGDLGLGAALAVVQLPFALALALWCLRRLRSRPRRPPRSEAAASPARAAASAAPRPLGAVPGSHAGPGRLAVPPVVRRACLRGAGMVAALAVMLFHLLPIYYTGVQAFRSVEEYAIGNPFWVYDPVFEDVREVLANQILWRWALNTLVIFGIVLVVGLAASLLAGYALARMRLRAGHWLASAMFLTYFVPPTTVLVPVYQLFHGWGLDDTVTGLVLLYLTLAVPFATWLFYTHFDGLSPEVEDHARLDGGRVRVFLRVVLPMSWPVVAAAGLFAVGMMASDVLYTSTFSLSHATKTLPGGLGLNALDLDEWAPANAAILLASLPLIGACAILSPYYVRGLRAALLEGA